MARSFIVNSSVGTIQAYLGRSTAVIVPVDETGEARAEVGGTVERLSDLAELLADVAGMPLVEAQRVAEELRKLAQARRKRWRWLRESN